jgi:probable phosphoglycerate mutase
MARVLLIRHGETDWNRAGRWQGHADVPLSELGRTQAAALGERLRSLGEAVTAIYTSDLARARDTARAVAAALGLASIEDRAWREMDVGRWSGSSRDEIRARYAEEWDRITAGEDLPRGGGETLAAFSARVAGALERVAAEHSGRRVAVVTHGGTIRVALLHALGLPTTRLREVAAVANTEWVELHATAGSWIVAGAADSGRAVSGG